MSLQIQPLHPNAPQMVTGVSNADGDINVSFEAVDGAEAYVPHYGDANTTDPHDAEYMGYTETTSWTLPVKDLPAGTKVGDKIPIYVQAYARKGIGSTDIEKARDLHDNHLGSAWSTVVEVTVTKIVNTGTP